MNRNLNNDNSDHSEVDFHRGNVLLRLSNTYPSLLQTIIESIQNAIDGSATRIFVGIDLRERFRRVSIADNGNGVDRSTFEQALGSVGLSIKKPGKLGRFGLGLISPLNKCQSFTFTTSPLTANRRSSVRWTFKAEDIRTQHHGVSIPRESIPGMPGVSKVFKEYLVGEYAQLYRTVVNMDKITADKVISIMDLDDLAEETTSKLGNAMRRSKEPITIKVVLIDGKDRVQTREIAASDFTGEKLPEVVYNDDVAGKITIALHRAQRRSGKRAGLVSVMEANSPSSISMKDFVRQARMTSMKDELKPALFALMSGYFEGTISAENITLSPERNKFENNDALHSLHMALWVWYDEHGKAQFQDEQDASRESRYQELGLKSQQRVHDFLSQPAGERIMAALQATVKNGRLGGGHVKPGSGRVGGVEETPSVRVGQGGAGKPRIPGNAPQPPKPGAPGPAKDRPGDKPFGVIGPRGTNRQIIRGDSLGLWYEHSVLISNSRLWEFDLEMGILTFNVKHPIWTRLDETGGKHLLKNERQIMHLQEWLTLEVLMLLVHYPDVQDFDDNRSLIDDKIKLHVEMFIAPSTTR